MYTLKFVGVGLIVIALSSLPLFVCGRGEGSSAGEIPENDKGKWNQYDDDIFKELSSAGEDESENGKMDEKQFTDMVKEIERRMRAYFQRLQRKVLHDPSIEPMLKGFVDTSTWFTSISTHYSNKTLIFYDDNSASEAQRINTTLRRCGIDFSLDKNKTEYFFVKLGAPSNYDDADIRVIRVTQDVVDHLRTNFGNHSLPMVFMHGMLVAGTSKELKDACAAVGNFGNKNPLVPQQRPTTGNNASTNSHFALTSYLAGVPPYDFYGEVVKSKNKRGKLLLLGKWSSIQTAKAYDMIMQTNPVANKFQVIDLDDPSLYKGVYNDKFDLNEKRKKWSAWLTNRMKGMQLPFLFYNGQFVGSISNLQQYVNKSLSLTMRHNIRYKVLQHTRRRKLESTKKISDLEEKISTAAEDVAKAQSAVDSAKKIVDEAEAKLTPVEGSAKKGDEFSSMAKIHYNRKAGMLEKAKKIHDAYVRELAVLKSADTESVDAKSSSSKKGSNSGNSEIIIKPVKSIVPVGPASEKNLPDNWHLPTVTVDKYSNFDPEDHSVFNNLLNIVSKVNERSLTLEE